MYRRGGQRHVASGKVSYTASNVSFGDHTAVGIVIQHLATGVVSNSSAC